MGTGSSAPPSAERTRGRRTGTWPEGKRRTLLQRLLRPSTAYSEVPTQPVTLRTTCTLWHGRGTEGREARKCNLTC